MGPGSRRFESVQGLASSRSRLCRSPLFRPERRSLAGETVLQDEKLLHPPSPKQMLLDDPFENRGVTLRIPSSVGIDHGDRASLADPEAVRLAAVDAPLLRKTQLLEPALQISPGGERALPFAALRLGLIAAQENMPLRREHPYRFGDLALRRQDLLPIRFRRHDDYYGTESPRRQTIFFPHDWIAAGEVSLDNDFREDANGNETFQ